MNLPTPIVAVRETLRKKMATDLKADVPDDASDAVQCLFQHVYGGTTARTLRWNCKMDESDVAALESARDVSLEDLIDTIRFETALEIIQTISNADLNAVAEATGYSNYRTFTRAFTRRLGKTPDDVRRAAAQDQ